jgi:hypothetical protein
MIWPENRDLARCLQSGFLPLKLAKSRHSLWILRIPAATSAPAAHPSSNSATSGSTGPNNLRNTTWITDSDSDDCAGENSEGRFGEGSDGEWYDEEELEGIPGGDR